MLVGIDWGVYICTESQKIKKAKRMTKNRKKGNVKMKKPETNTKNRSREPELLAAFRECSSIVQDKIIDIAKLYADRERRERACRQAIHIRPRKIIKPPPREE